MDIPIEYVILVCIELVRQAIQSIDLEMI